MKNTLKIMLLVAFATFAFTSCNKENTPAVQQDTVLDFTMDYANFSGNDTKGTKKNWENGDLVYLIFKKKDATEFDYKNYVKMEYNATTKKWSVAKGQDVLNNLPNGEGKVEACHHTGITDPSLNTDETMNVFPNDNESRFALWLGSSIAYTKTTGKITAALKFKPTNEFQFNIKGLEFVENKYKLYIYDGSVKVASGGFVKFYSYKYGVSYISTDDFPAQKGIDEKEISFFVSILSYKFDDTKKSINADGTYTYKFNPTFELEIKIGSKYYYAQRTITKDIGYTEYNAYSLYGPTATDAVIEAAKSGDPLGNHWTLK